MNYEITIKMCDVYTMIYDTFIVFQKHFRLHLNIINFIFGVTLFFSIDIFVTNLIAWFSIIDTQYPSPVYAVLILLVHKCINPIKESILFLFINHTIIQLNTSIQHQLLYPHKPDIYNYIGIGAIISSLSRLGMAIRVISRTSIELASGTISIIYFLYTVIHIQYHLTYMLLISSILIFASYSPFLFKILQSRFHAWTITDHKTSYIVHEWANRLHVQQNANINSSSSISLIENEGQAWKHHQKWILCTKLIFIILCILSFAANLLYLYTLLPIDQLNKYNSIYISFFAMLFRLSIHIQSLMQGVIDFNSILFKKLSGYTLLAKDHAPACKINRSEHIHKVHNSSPIMQINFTQVSLKINSNYILHNTSLNIPILDSVGIIGENGCGKSFLCKLIAQKHPLSSGTISFTLDDKTSINIYFIPQNTTLSYGNIVDHIQFGLWKQYDIEGLFYALNVVDLYTYVTTQWSCPDHNICIMSSGEAYRLEIAKAILSCPDLVIMDESLDNIDKRLHIPILSHFQKTKIPIIVVSHNMDVIKLMQQIITIQNKKLCKISNVVPLAPTLVKL